MTSNDNTVPVRTVTAGSLWEMVVSGCIVGLVSLAGACGLVWWISAEPLHQAGRRVPVAANFAAHSGEQGGIVNIEGEFRQSDGRASGLTGAWPGFRGAKRDNVCADAMQLADEWPAGGPPALWSIALGEGYAGPAVRNGCVYILDYDEARKADCLRCLSLDDGREIWRRWYCVRLKRNHGISRTVPSVTDAHVVSIGPRCHVLCADARTGSFRWGIDMAAQYKTEVPLWYTGQCPLIDGSTAVLAPAGTVLMTGVDCETGRILWQTPNPRGWRMSHSSIMPMEFGGRRMYVYCAIGGIVGVSADPPDRGAVLWETDAWNHSVVAPSPVSLGDGRIFLTAGYGVGSMMIRLREQAGVFSVETLASQDKTVFACEQHTPVFYGGNLYTVLPNDAGAFKKEFVCMSPDSGILWRSGKQNRFGLGPFLVADGKLFVLNDDGVLTLIRASGEQYVQLARARVLTGREAWGPMALADGRLLVRDFNSMVCLDVSWK